MASYYPPVGFHFRVEFEGITNVKDVGFQSVSGLNASVPNSETYEEGGENRFTHRLPKRATYENLVLKRGMFTDSELIQWFRDAIENFIFRPRTVTVILQNENHEPLETWRFVNAWPTKWNIDGFDAEKAGIVVETIELSYQYFRRVRVQSPTQPPDIP